MCHCAGPGHGLKLKSIIIVQKLHARINKFHTHPTDKEWLEFSLRNKRNWPFSPWAVCLSPKREGWQKQIAGVGKGTTFAPQIHADTTF